MVDIKLLILGALGIILILALVIVFSIADNYPGKHSYVEIALDDPNCANGFCLEEYFLVSSELIFKKTQTADKKVFVEIRRLNGSESINLIDEVSKKHNFDVPLDEKSAQYHMYTIGDKFQKSYCNLGDLRCDELFSKLKSTFESSTETDYFFIQFVYWKAGDDVVQDYHIFGDGLVAHSEFAPKGELVNSQLYVLPKDIVSELNSMVGNIKEIDIKCNNDQFVYGYLLIDNGSDSLMINTCGGGSGLEDEMFNYLIENV
jgi:hypothetical protein